MELRLDVYYSLHRFDTSTKKRAYISASQRSGDSWEVLAKYASIRQIARRVARTLLQNIYQVLFSSAAYTSLQNGKAAFSPVFTSLFSPAASVLKRQHQKGMHGSAPNVEYTNSPVK